MVEDIYKKMYYHLFNRITDALEAYPKLETKDILMKAQLEAEEMYMSYGDEENDSDVFIDDEGNPHLTIKFPFGSEE